ncbi:TadE/TadG family type IV pilus assembly protein [Microvirga massiliensis]|uniref:TadE/TadG family type IV pilus assembly protein n=1 Tax=Microvirga massiliensis TaxID=1033741 RepID=UPI00093C0174
MRNRSFWRRFRRDSSGALLVEISVVFPMILLLTFGTVEAGLFLFQSNAASKATQLGARWAVVNSPISTTVAAAMNSTGAWNGGTLGKNCVDLNGGCPQVFTRVTCTSGGSGCTDALMNLMLTEMTRALPDLKAGEVKITYESYPVGRQLGFAGRPGGLPVDVIVEIRCRTYRFPVLSSWFQWALPPIEAGCPTTDKDNKPIPRGIPIPPSRTRLSSESLGPPS